MAHTDTTPKNYIVREEYREAWGSPAPGTVIGMDEIVALAREWGKSVDELMTQVEPADAPAIFVADDDGTTVELRARTIEEAREETRREWESATPGTYTVGIYKYDNDGTPEIVETITVVAR